MFSVRQKREIAGKVQAILRETNHPELSKGNIRFKLRVEGAESWSFADIMDNQSAMESSGGTPNPWNEQMDPRNKEKS